jgi:hypothetical protein
MGKVKTFTVELCERKEIRNFIEKWHYSQNINGLISDYCFKLLDGDKRLCCIDDTPKNTESYFIGKTLRWLKKNTDIKRVISYADMTYNHEGTIYKASNFKHCGMTAKGRVIMYQGKRYHDKTIRTKYKGELKPFAKKVKEALETGEAEYVKTQGKHIYIYEF